MPALVFIKTSLFFPLGKCAIKSKVILGKLNPCTGEIIIINTFESNGSNCEMSVFDISNKIQSILLATANSEIHFATCFELPVPEK
jgi:hypothetical protein